MSGRKGKTMKPTATQQGEGKRQLIWEDASSVPAPDRCRTCLQLGHVLARGSERHCTNCGKGWDESRKAGRS